jgi:outer membrane assembly lipoprotein YfiO
MKKGLVSALLVLGFTFSHLGFAQAFWVWTSQKGKFENPAFAPQETAKAQMDYAMTLFEAGDYEKALKEFKKLPKHFPETDEAGHAQYYFGVCLEETKSYYPAFQAYEKVLTHFPKTDQFHDIVEREFRIANHFFHREEKKLMGVTVPVLTGIARDRALEIYRAVVSNDPFGTYARTAQSHIGLILFSDEEYAEAIQEFEALRRMEGLTDQEEEEASFHVSIAKLNIALQVDFDEERILAALESFEEFTRAYPGSKYAPVILGHVKGLNNLQAEERYEIAVFYEKQKYYTSAKVYYNEVIEKFPQTQWADRARERATGVEILMQEKIDQ